MENKKIVMMKLEDIKPYENNPRNNDDAVDMVAKSIAEFGFQNPIIVDKNNVVIAGHTRLKASYKLGLKEAPVIVADDLTKDQANAYRLVDNRTNEVATWNFKQLEEELKNIDLDMNAFDFNFDIENNNKKQSEEVNDEEKKYSTKVDLPQYQITGEEPQVDELIDDSKYKQLVDDIQKSNISEKNKMFLLYSASRHLVFNYSKIAEYYAHQDEQMQNLMEKSALVIIDYEDAIKNGYVELTNELNKIKLKDEEYDDDDE